MDFSAWLKANGYDESALQSDGFEKQHAHLKAAWEAETNPPSGEEGRQFEIQRALSRYSQNANADKKAKLQAIADQAIAEGWDAKRTGLALHREERAVGPMTLSPRANKSPGGADLLTAGLALSAGVPEAYLAKEYGQQLVDMAVSAPNRGTSFHSVIRHVLAEHGEHPMGRINDTHIRRVFELSQNGMMAGGAGISTYSLPGILGAAVNKIALAAWAGEAVTWRTLAKRTNVRDFKVATSYRMTASGAFKLNPPAGEIKHESLTESAYTLQLSTYAAMLGISRQDQINDDLTMFESIPRLFGRGAAVLIEKLFYTRFLNSGSFFVAGNNNVSAGVLGLAGLDAAYKIFLNQKDENLDPVLIQPRYLLAPPSLIMTARSLVLRDTKIITGNAADRSDGNPWAGTLEPLTSPFMENTALTGNSAIAYYLLCGPSDFSCVQVGFLDGQEAPTTETAQLDFNTLGLGIRSYIDVGCAFLEPRGGVRSTGA